MSILSSAPTSKRLETTTLTRLASRRLQYIATTELSSEVRRKAATCLLDFLGACIGGLSSPWAPAVLSYVGSHRGFPQAHQWGLSEAVTAEDAAFGNSVLGHSLIRDDMHVKSGTHIGVLVVPAVLALAQREHLSGREIIRGLVGGYEMAVRLGTAVRSGGSLERHFRPSGINGAFGAASAAIAASGLDEDTAVHALGFAANAAAGLNEWPWAGGEEIYTHTGMAARGGLAAFDLARAGMHSSDSVLEGPDGLFNAYGAGSVGAESFAASLQGPFGIMEVRHKPFSGCNLIQSQISAALEVARQLGERVEEINEVTITTFSSAQRYPGCDNTGPFERIQQSKMSLQYGVASALLYGRVDEQTFKNFSDSRLERLIACCRIEVDSDMDSSVARMIQPARVEVRLVNGEVYRAAVDDVAWLSEDAVEERFRREAAAALTSKAIEQIVESVHGLWELDDCSPLFEAFASAQH